MLTLITGPAGAGKTARCMAEIRDAARRGLGDRLLIVPEQYSHEAERELCRAVGDCASLYAEVMSFTGLARRVEEELGSRGRAPLDKGGRLLCMALALSSVGSRLSVYSSACRRAEMQLALLSAVDELKAARVGPEVLETASALCSGALSRKLSDLALILAAYDAVAGGGRADPADRLTRLAEALPESRMGRCGHIYFDGFTDFTGQEFEIVRLLLGKGADVTVCLTVDGLYEGSEVFELSRRTGRALLRCAREQGLPCRETRMEDGDDSPALFLCRRLFTYSNESFPGGDGGVELLSAPTVGAECEAAAAKCVRLCREEGLRWRDVAVAVRGFEDYRGALEAAFAYYGVPLFAARKSDILQKPVPALIASAYEILQGGWETDDVLAYLRTGLCGLTERETDILENYCLLWSCRAAQWLSPKDWRMHPEGYGGHYDESCRERLAEINALRRAVAGPLLALRERCAAAHTALEQSAALSALFEDLALPEKLAARSDALEAEGRAALAAEYARLWDITVGALEQTALILGDTPMDAETFSRLFLLTLSQYDVGIIPVSPDMVTAGDFDRMRRRNIRHLIVLGASDERLPGGTSAAGVFTGDERRALLDRGIDLGGGEDAELWREFALIYNCLSLPSEGLTLVTPAYGGDGAPARPSFVMSRAARLFGLTIRPADGRRAKLAAPGPALELAAESLRVPGDPLAIAARDYFEITNPDRLADIGRAAAQTRGSLSAEAARTLYGERLWLSASRIDKFSSCRFAYFMQYGLKAKPREAAEFSPPEYGTLIHYILQNVARDVSSAGGFGKLSERDLGELTDKYLEAYIASELPDFSERSARFQYLFRRLGVSARRIVCDMAEELRSSGFQPLDFELDFSRLGGEARPMPDGGELRLAGVADRVDGWVHAGRLYLRVVDYKTGRKSFSLSDVIHGRDLQMLLYLFTLQDSGAALYGRETLPAGVLYVPARYDMVSADGDISDEELDKKRRAGLKRSGLVLSDPEVLRAMEDSDAPLRLPVRWKEGVPSGDALCSAERLGLLKKNVEQTLSAMASELKRGSIAADPYYKGAQDNACLRCDYLDACRFSDGEGGDRRRYIEKLPATRVWNILEGKDVKGGADNG